MYNLKKLFFTCIVLISCSCNKPPCVCDFDSRLFVDCKIVDNQGHNLIIGTSPIYKIDSIKILNKLNDLSVNNASVNKEFLDSTVVALNFYIPATKNYIYYGRAYPQDSLEIDWIMKTGKCCGGPETYYTVGSVKFNNVIIQPQNGIYYFVK